MYLENSIIHHCHGVRIATSATVKNHSLFVPHASDEALTAYGQPEKLFLKSNLLCDPLQNSRK